MTSRKQVHLSTLIIMALAGGAWMELSVERFPFYDDPPTPEAKPYRCGIRLGWPMVAYRTPYIPCDGTGVNASGMILDPVLGVSVLLAVYLSLEKLVPRLLCGMRRQRDEHG